jgi:hypothetical protein
MLRILFLLIVGIAIGYMIGFNDARTHDRHIVQRLVDRAGGSARSGVSNDIDARLEKAANR